MITPAYCHQMARYNSWQNEQIFAALDGQSHEVLTQNRGAFFGSILGTLNHLLWGDLMWMSRFDADSTAPGGTIAASVGLTPDHNAWRAQRLQTDAAIARWANATSTQALARDLTWNSSAAQREVRCSLALCVVHMFNHQTHHRGQVHAMMTQIGLTAPVSDLVFMPETA